MRLRQAPLALAALVLGATGLSACSHGAVGSSGNQGFVSGNGVVTPVARADRRTPGPVAGTTLEGRRIALSDFRGRIVVVNVWGAWCGPCQAEAPALAAAARSLGRTGVGFLGVDSRDLGKALPRAFQRTYGTPYPSIYDPEGRTLLAFHGTLPLNAIPSTVIIDRKGRVAASVSGSITRTTLEDMVEDVAGGRSS